MAKRARKTKLTKAVLKKIQSCQGKAYTDSRLAELIGISATTFSLWRTKGSRARSGLFRDFYKALEADEAAVEERFVNPWMKKVDQGDIKAIELGLKRHPRMRRKFKEEPVEVEGGDVPIKLIVSKELKELFE